MPDGLFTQRPSAPPPVDLDAVVREVVEFEDPDTHDRNVTVPLAWTIEDRAAPWPMLVLHGIRCSPEGLPEPWSVRYRIPFQRALAREVRAGVERACLELARYVEERRREGYTFEDEPPRPVVSAARGRARGSRRARG